MPRHSIHIAAALVLTAAASATLGAQPWPAPTAEFRPGASGGVSAFYIRNTALEHVVLPGSRDVLLSVEQKTWSDADEEEHGGTIRVHARGWDGTAFTREMWTVESAADRWSLEPFGYLRLSQYGCCDLDVTHTLYDLATGREVAWYTDGPPLSTWDREGRPVLIAYESPRSTRVPAEVDPLAVQGRLRLIRGAEVADEVVIAGSGETETGYVSPTGLFCDGEGRIQQRAPDGMDDDSPLHVCFQFESDAWARIPIRGGRFDLEGATLPQGIALVRGGW